MFAVLSWQVFMPLYIDTDNWNTYWSFWSFYQALQAMYQESYCWDYNWNLLEMINKVMWGLLLVIPLKEDVSPTIKIPLSLKDHYPTDTSSQPQYLPQSSPSFELGKWFTEKSSPCPYYFSFTIHWNICIGTQKKLTELSLNLNSGQTIIKANRE